MQHTTRMPKWPNVNSHDVISRTSGTNMGRCQLYYMRCLNHIWYRAQETYNRHGGMRQIHLYWKSNMAAFNDGVTLKSVLEVKSGNWKRYHSRACKCSSFSNCQSAVKSQYNYATVEMSRYAALLKAIYCCLRAKVPTTVAWASAMLGLMGLELHGSTSQLVTTSALAPSDVSNAMPT